MNIDPEKGMMLLVNKPLGWTSFDAVNKIKHAIYKYQREHLPPPVRDEKNPKQKPPRVRIGHAGTLDPLASGLLIVCIGKETKNIETYMGLEKEYTGSFFLGATTPTYDAETEPDQLFETSHITYEMIMESVKKFIGDLEQMPPVYSAIKKDGKRAYRSARQGEEITMALRNVVVHEFEITGIEMPMIHFRVVCSKGTYIRSLVYDFGKALGSGAYLASLCRTRIGQFSLENAVAPDEVVVDSMQ